MKLKLNLGSFEYLTLDINVESFSFSGSIEGYPSKDIKSKNVVRFTLSDPSKNEEVMEQIKAAFNYNPEYADVNDYVKLTVKEDSILGTTSRISIIFDNGYQGMQDAPYFSFAE